MDRNDQPLTQERQKFVVDLLERHPNPIAFVRAKFPRLYAACIAVRLEDDDINQVARAGIIRAAQKFAPERSVMFSTYAMH